MRTPFMMLLGMTLLVLMVPLGPLPIADAADSGSATVGSPAPDFTLNDTDGKPVSLSSLRGKTVVLEWFNPDCPFVRYAHGPGGPLRTQPPRVLSDSVVWLAINSSAPGKQGHGTERNRAARTEYAMKYPVLLDEDGKVGRQYGARTTPHLFVIDANGTLAYAGGLDGAPMGNGNRANHVDACLEDLAAGKAVRKSTSKPYGCSVKYGKGS